MKKLFSLLLVTLGFLSTPQFVLASDILPVFQYCNIPTKWDANSTKSFCSCFIRNAPNACKMVKAANPSLLGKCSPLKSVLSSLENANKFGFLTKSCEWQSELNISTQQQCIDTAKAFLAHENDAACQEAISQAS